MSNQPKRTEFRLVRGKDVQVVNSPAAKVQLEFDGWTLEKAPAKPAPKPQDPDKK